MERFCNGKKEVFDEGCENGKTTVLLKEKHPMQLVMDAHLAFSAWCLIGGGIRKKPVSY